MASLRQFTGELLGAGVGMAGLVNTTVKGVNANMVCLETIGLIGQTNLNGSYKRAQAMVAVQDLDIECEVEEAMAAAQTRKAAIKKGTKAATP